MALITQKYRVNPTKDATFRTKSIKFGDGYEQRSIDGINYLQEKWNITFICESETERDNLQNIIKTAAGVTAIQWQSPDSNVNSDWLIRSYQMLKQSQFLYEITCVIEKIYEI